MAFAWFGGSSSSTDGASFFYELNDVVWGTARQGQVPVWDVNDNVFKNQFVSIARYGYTWYTNNGVDVDMEWIGGVSFTVHCPLYLTDTYTPPIHDNQSVPKKYVDDMVTSGTYTPTIIHVTNIQSSGSLNTLYSKVGKIVDVSMKLNLNTISTGASEFEVSLPINTNISNIHSIIGTGIEISNNTNFIVSSNSISNTAVISFNSQSTNNQTVILQFRYEVTL
jgi:hypothetical protein